VYPSYKGVRETKRIEGKRSIRGQERKGLLGEEADLEPMQAVLGLGERC
jgi:hypothetical protein